MRRKISFFLFVSLILLSGYFFRFVIWWESKPYIPKASLQDIFGWSTDRDNTITTIKNIKNKLHPHDSILHNTAYTQLLETLETLCPEWIRDSWSQLYDAYVSYAVDVLDVYNLKDWARVFLTAEKFITHSSQFASFEKASLREYCTRTYWSLKYQELLTQIHAWFILDAWIEREFKTIWHIAPTAESIKSELINYSIQYAQWWLELSEELIKQAWIDQTSTTYSLEWLEKQTMEMIYAKTIKLFSELMTNKIFSPSQINHIAQWLSFATPKSCTSSRNWTYEYLPSHSRTNHVAQATTPWEEVSFLKKDTSSYKWISITIPLCMTYENLLSLALYYEYTLLHELWHYYHDTVDSTYQTFTQKCRKDITTQNWVCSEWDFISTYAATSSLEDYAESRAWYMHDKIYKRNRYAHLASFKRWYFDLTIPSK